MKGLGMLKGDSASEAHAINNKGQIVGLSSGPHGDRAVTWKQGKIHALPTPGALSSAAFGINDRGQIVGQAILDGLGARAVLWQGGEMRVLGTLGGSTTSSAESINEHGQITGSSSTATESLHAFLFEKG